MKTRSTKRALMLSLLSLMLCVSMLIGSTYAWFTDSVTSSNNIIKSGKLDVTMEYYDGTKVVPAVDSTEWKDASNVAIFDYQLWEPGYVQVRHIKIANEGSLALMYQLNIAANGEVSKLADVIDVYFVDPATQIADRTALANAEPEGTLTEVLAGMPANTSGELEANTAVTVTIALKMRETAGNEYQNLSIGSDFSVQLLATQLTAEEDSFDDQYDKDAGYDAGKTNVGPYKLNVLSGGTAIYDDETKTYNVAVNSVAQGGYNASQGGKYYAGYTVNVAGYGENATLKFDKNGTEVTWKLADEERDGFINNGVHQQWTSVGISRAYRYDIDGDGVTDFTVLNDVSNAKVEASDAAQLKNLLEAGISAVLTADVNVTVADTGITIAKNSSATLDLNGHDIIADSTSAEGVQLFSVSGNLDVVGSGTISLTNDDYAWTTSYRYTTINVRETGVVTLGEGVNVVCEAGNNTAKGYGMAYAVDIYTTGTLNVNGASLHSNYIAVRCFYGASVVNVNSGSITSSNNNYGIWPQSATGAQINIAPGIPYTMDSSGFGIYIFG